VNEVLDVKVTPQQLTMDAESLALFRGRNAMRCVSPNTGNVTRNTDSA